MWDTIMVNEDIARYYIEFVIGMRDMFVKKNNFSLFQWTPLSVIEMPYHYPINYYFAYCKTTYKYNRKTADLFQLAQIMLDENESRLQEIINYNPTPFEFEMIFKLEIEEERRLLLNAIKALSGDAFVKKYQDQAND